MDYLAVFLIGFLVGAVAYRYASRRYPELAKKIDEKLDE
jgi:hypothetical protein